MITAAFWAKANPSAVPRIGAVQAWPGSWPRTPLKNAPAAPCFEANAPAAPITPPPRFTSNSPNRFKATSVTSIVSTTRNCGL